MLNPILPVSTIQIPLLDLPTPYHHLPSILDLFFPTQKWNSNVVYTPINHSFSAPQKPKQGKKKYKRKGKNSQFVPIWLKNILNTSINMVTGDSLAFKPSSVAPFFSPKKHKWSKASWTNEKTREPMRIS